MRVIKFVLDVPDSIPEGITEQLMGFVDKMAQVVKDNQGDFGSRRASIELIEE